MEDMITINKHGKFFYREIILILFVCVFVAITDPVKAYAAPLVYQCVGKNVYAETTGCTQTQFIPGSTALRMLTFALRDFDKAKTAGNVSEQTKQTSEIVKQLTILEYPIGADPIVAARSLLNVDVPKQEEAAVKGLVCDGVMTNLFNPICWARTIAAVVSSLLISVAAWALAIAGVLFNWAIMNSVILFKDVIFEPIKDGINIGWTAFRDISNIVIIGVFAFIAISIILGNKTFGDKKLVARVLIIAILINFSLLFTKMIIDASNFTAGQFYAATQEGGGKTLSQIIDEENQSRKSGVATASSGVNPFDGYSRKGIAGQFVNFLGVTSIADTYVGMREIAESTSNGWLTLVHGLFAMILLLGAAIVLFYGSFLLISRAIILIFLLLTSAIAFASHLIPKMSDGQFGWSAWWKSLLGSAVLAPLLMIFLYITLQIAGNLTAGTSGTISGATSASAVRMTAAVGATSQVAAVDTATQTVGGTATQAKGTLGNLISKSATKGDINALFNYLIVLGLLFGSFKVASSFSSKIGGFNFAAMATALPLTLGSRMAGFALRNTVGRGAALTEKMIGDQLGRSRRDLSQIDPEKNPRRYAEVQSIANRLEGRKRLAGWFTKQNYDLGQSGIGKQIAKQTGVKSLLSPGDARASFAESAKKTAEAASVRAEAAYNLTRGDQEKIRAREQKRQETIFKKQAENLKQQKDALKQQADAAAAVAQTSRQQADTNKQALQQQKVVAERTAQAVESQAKARKDDLESAIRELQKSVHHGDTAAAGEIAQKRSAIRMEDNRIKAARTSVDEIQQHIDAFEENAVRDSRASKEKNRAHEEKSHEYDAHMNPEGAAARKMRNDVEKAVSSAIEGSRRPGAEAAERYATNMLSRMLGRQTYKGQKAKSEYEEKWAKAKLRKNLEPLIEELKAQQAGTTGSPAGTAGGGATTGPGGSHS